LNALGRHFLLELKDCDSDAVNDMEFLKTCLRTAAEKAGATVVNEAFYKFTPYGISGVVIIAESHLFVHTWPEYCYAAVDIFTCGTNIRPEKAAEFIVKELGCQNPSMMEIRRGLIEDLEAKLPVKAV
jgi:S-adenosylmethionine decarboxylase